ncbi:M20/M25/M40 family metallo-hydrolase [Polymorphobacter fuscus]|uniref:M20/M25/M40 family metallo-hydrolase n=1 Tax=Sandarakinorhabdus fusca TaxID=1439888 RepID=UPI0016A14782|nr:M20/M25/M40 family metallo-hydrolase [Polymorphobacter fuscus]NJC09792.1 acetylornithine deacetylase/succinyl-diaminopimelate desuccinylase-like protein [Polymorphobacter fuscus]
MRPIVLAAVLAAAAPAHGAPATVADARALLARGVAFDTVKGRGKVPAYADFLKSQLVAAGFAPADIRITPVGETANLHLAWKGNGTRPPIAITGHMDVVEADPKDWARDPFTATEDGGYLFGRGVGDNKFDVSMVVATLAAMKREGFRPNRDIHLFLSGDEETDGLTAEKQAAEAKAAGVALMLNSDGGGGLDAGGAASGYSLSAAEKTYADYRLTVTNPGGHSSRPTSPNAIAQLAAAASRVDAYRFAPQINEITRASLTAEGQKQGGAIGNAMVAFARNPGDAAAIATLRADPASIGQIATTCVPTMMTGGHAPNALPQKAALTVNCRIFPGTSVEATRKTIETIVADPAVKVETAQEWVSTPASPLRPDVMAAVTRAVAAAHPGIVPVPAMDAGASDSVYYRAVGIPSYGVSALFMKPEDQFAHGLNERIPLAAIAPALTQWHSLITAMAQ